MSQPTQPRTDVAYDVNEMPPWREAIPLGIQHVLAMFVGNVAPPLIIAGAIGAASGETAFLVQVALLMAGVSTLIQALGIGPSGPGYPSCRARASPSSPWRSRSPSPTGSPPSSAVRWSPASSRS